jgi:hypothetical protein
MVLRVLGKKQNVAGYTPGMSFLRRRFASGSSEFLTPSRKLFG